MINTISAPPRVVGRRVLALLTTMAIALVLTGMGATSAQAATSTPAIVAGSPTTNPFTHFTEYNGLLYFSAVNGAVNSLYSYDGVNPAVLIAGSIQDPNYLVVTNGRLFFGGYNGTTTAMYSYDSTTALAPIAITGSPSQAGRLFVSGGLIYFSAFDNISMSVRAFIYNPLTPLSAPVLMPGSPVGTFEFTVYSSVLYFGGYSGVNNLIYRYNPATPATPAAVISGSPPSPGSFTVYGGLLYFGGSNGTSTVLYSYDGIAFAQVAGSPTGTSGFTVYDGNLYFSANNGTSYVLYRYDGTTLTEIVGSPLYPSALSVYAGKLYFSGDPSIEAAAPRMWVLATLANPAVLAATGLNTALPLGLASAILLAGGLALAVVRRRALPTQRA